ncbi:MAG: hypothetical protein NPINA01_33260 [Nitrospinaceae bacterium]|nr:MAG: hypothetical protein NPINA01_33260 [Nitrospinaceae bacterium]
MKGLLKTVYRDYKNSDDNLVGKVHWKLISSPLVAKWTFGLKMIPGPAPKRYLFDLTTVLLKLELKKILSQLKDSKILEIGVGNYAILSGWLSRHVNQHIDATDVDPGCVESARKYIDANSFNVNAIQSDLFSSVQGKKYDLIFWNLPYYRDPVFLDGLFEQAPDMMADRARLIIGYNTTPLPRKKVLEFLERHDGLELDKVVTYSWNLHDLMVLKKTGN